MAEAGFLEQKRVRPGAVALVVVMHGAALTALLLAKNPEVVRRVFRPIDVIDVPIPPPPPPLPPTPRPEPRQQIERYTVPPVPMPPRNDSPVVRDPPPPLPPQRDALAGNENVAGPVLPPRPPIPDPPRPVPTPVRTAAVLISGDLQPPYPTSEQRMEREGRVVIRVTIGPDGRVIAAQKVSATSDAFYQATERHARARWRFRPATVDGRPVEATKTMTVVFELDG